MLISMQTGGLEQALGIDGTFRALAETGFDAADVNINLLHPAADVKARKPLPYCLRKEAPEREVTEAVRPYLLASREYGVPAGQTHALFPSLLQSEPVPGDAEYNAALLEGIRRMIIATASLDCDKMVVHPFFLHYPGREEPDLEWETNLRSFLALADTAREYGVKVCVENMQFPDRGGHRIAGPANTKYEAAEYVDTLNELAGAEVFGFCLDTGHAFIGGNEIKNFITYMGDRITCLHVNDNDGNDDQHLSPYMGKIPWEDLTDGLAKIRYRGILNFEPVGYVKRVPEMLLPGTLRYIYETGRVLADIIEEKEAE